MIFFIIFSREYFYRQLLYLRILLENYKINTKQFNLNTMFKKIVFVLSI